MNYRYYLIKFGFSSSTCYYSLLRVSYPSMNVFEKYFGSIEHFKQQYKLHKIEDSSVLAFIMLPGNSAIEINTPKWPNFECDYSNSIQYKDGNFIHFDNIIKIY